MATSVEQEKKTEMQKEYDKDTAGPSVHHKDPEKKNKSRKEQVTLPKRTSKRNKK